MKELKITGTFQSEVIKAGEDFAPWSIQDILMAALTTPPKEGSNYAHIASVATVIRQLNKANIANEEVILIEKADHIALVRALKSMNFKVVDPAFMTYIDSVEKLPDITVEKSK